MKPVESGVLAPLILSALLLMGASGSLQAEDYAYVTNNGTITILRYTGPGGAVAVPDRINDLPVARIGDEAFINCGELLEVTIPGSVTNIGAAAFQRCVNLASAALSDGLISLGDQAFQWCSSLTNIHIPASMDSIGDSAFLGCGSLLEISVDDRNTRYRSRDGILFDHNQSTLLTCPGGRVGNVAIPDGVTVIGYEAFALCSFLSGVDIPGSVASIEDSAFAGCGRLTRMALPQGVTNIGRYAFATCLGLAEVSLSTSVANLLEGAFYKCTNLTSITIPGCVASVSREAFSLCSGLTNAVLLTGVGAIGKQAFYECTSLATVTIPKSVTWIGEEAFFYCTKLTGAFFEGSPPRVGLYAFDFDPNAIIYYLPGTTGWGATYGMRPTAQWVLPYPVILTTAPGFGPQTNGFGFIISWATNAAVAVEATVTLAPPSWSPVGTNTLNGGWSGFNDPRWNLFPGRFYRIRHP